MSGDDASGYGLSGRAGDALAEPAGALDAAPRARGVVRVFLAVVVVGAVVGAVVDATMTVGAAAAAGAPTVVNVVGVITGADSAVFGAAVIAAAVVVVLFAGCLPPLSKRRSCGQNRATDPIPTAMTSAAIPMRNAQPLRACSGAARRSGGRLGLMFPGA